MGTMLSPSAAITNEDTWDAFTKQRKLGSKCQGNSGWSAWWNSPPPRPMSDDPADCQPVNNEG